MTGRDDAADLLIHYMRLALESAGREWDSDYSAELRDLVDRIVDAAVGEAREVAEEEVRAHAENEPHIYADGSTS